MVRYCHMEGFKHKDYRSDIYKKMKEKNNEPSNENGDISERQKLYQEVQITSEYIEAKKMHQEETRRTKESYGPEAELLAQEINKNFEDEYFSNDAVYNSQLSIFTNLAKKERRVKLTALQKIFSSSENVLRDYHGQKYSKEIIKVYKILKDSLKNSTLIDLGCGSHNSVDNAYDFALMFNCKKYIGVDKFLNGDGIRLGSTEEEYEKVFETRKKFFKKINEDPDIDPIEHELIREDMLEFLAKRTEQSNFMINGIEIRYIIPAGEAGEEYMDKVFYHIARLVPKGGIVFGRNTTHIDLLGKYGFTYLELKENHEQLDIFLKND